MRTARSSSQLGVSPPAGTPRTRHPPPRARYPLGPGTPLGPGNPPAVNRITDTCKNITFPQLRLRAVMTHSKMGIDPPPCAGSAHVHKLRAGDVHAHIAHWLVQWNLSSTWIQILRNFSFWRKNLSRKITPISQQWMSFVSLVSFEGFLCPLVQLVKSLV